jgi:hypothetical protein
MTSPTDFLGTLRNEGVRDRAPLEEAMAKHAARQRWLGPLGWLVVATILAGVIIGALLIVFGEMKSISPPEATRAGVIRTIVSTVSESMPSGSRLLSDRYPKPRSHSCNVEAHFVYYVPPSTGVARHRWTLDPSSAPYSWDESVNFAAPGQEQIDGDILLNAKVISRSSDTWEIDASSAGSGC